MTKPSLTAKGAATRIMDDITDRSEFSLDSVDGKALLKMHATWSGIIDEAIAAEVSKLRGLLSRFEYDTHGSTS